MTLTEDFSEEYARALLQQDFWSKEDGIAEALKRGHDPLTPDDVFEALNNGEAQYWWTDNSCVITSVTERGGCRICHIWLATGKLKECLRLEKEVNRFASEMNCDRIEVAGRDGWLRVLSKRGYRKARIVLTKDLRDERR